MILRSGIRLVEVGDDVISTIESFSRGAQTGKEAGGILIGSYRGPHVEILHCTTPMPADRRFWSLFDRRDPGHHEHAMKHWHDSGRTATFVGEWHTHPEPVPTPSFIDRATWKRVGKRHKIGPLVFVIRGFSGWWWGLMQHKNLSPLVQVDAPFGRSATERDVPNRNSTNGRPDSASVMLDRVSLKTYTGHSAPLRREP